MTSQRVWQMARDLILKGVEVDERRSDGLDGAVDERRACSSVRVAECSEVKCEMRWERWVWVRRSSSTGRPCIERASRPTIGPPRLVRYGIMEGVRHGQMPGLLEPIVLSTF